MEYIRNENILAKMIRRYLIMSVKWEKQEGNKGTLTVEVPAEEVTAGLDKAFKKVVKTSTSTRIP